MQSDLERGMVLKYTTQSSRGVGWPPQNWLSSKVEFPSTLLLPCNSLNRVQAAEHSTRNRAGAKSHFRRSSFRRFAVSLIVLITANIRLETHKTQRPFYITNKLTETWSILSGRLDTVIFSFCCSTFKHHSTLFSMKFRNET